MINTPVIPVILIYNQMIPYSHRRCKLPPDVKLTAVFLIALFCGRTEKFWYFFEENS